MENQALLDIVSGVDALSTPAGRRGGTGLDGQAVEGPRYVYMIALEGPGFVYGMDVHELHEMREPVRRTQERPFDRMNGIAASLMLNLTSSVRFEGSLNGACLARCLPLLLITLNDEGVPASCRCRGCPADRLHSF